MNDTGRESLINTVTIAHIQLDIIAIGERFMVLLKTKHDKPTSIGIARTLPEAETIVRAKVEEIQACLDAKRNHEPTANQLKTLFSLKVPIPINLTFGEASHLIDAALTRKRQERQERNARQEQEKQRRQAAKQEIAKLLRSTSIRPLPDEQRAQLIELIRQKNAHKRQ